MCGVLRGVLYVCLLLRWHVRCIVLCCGVLCWVDLFLCCDGCLSGLLCCVELRCASLR